MKKSNRDIAVILEYMLKPRIEAGEGFSAELIEKALNDFDRVFPEERVRG